MNRYILIGVSLVITVAMALVSYLRAEKQQAVDDLERARILISQLQAANSSLSSTVYELEDSARKTAAFLVELNLRNRLSEQKAQAEMQQFKRVKNESETVKSWADTPLPPGLYDSAADY